MFKSIVLSGAALAALTCAQQVPGSADRQNGNGKVAPFGFDVPQDHRPGLFYREDFKGPPQGIHEMPAAQQFLANPNLELKLYGPGGIHVQIDHHEGEPKDDPDFLWSGITPAPWAVAFRHRENNVDLSGLARIKWRTQQTGYHALHPIVKLSS